MSEFEIWINPDPFYFGTLQAHSKLSTVYLKKVITYARSKSKDGGYPKLSWSIWKHIATNKMLLPENLAWALFDTFYTLKECSREDRLLEAELLQQYLEKNSLDAYKLKMKVNTMEFILFLFLQRSIKTSLRTSIVGDEWPGASPRSKSQSLDTSHLMKSGSMPNIFDEHNHLTFVFSHLTEMLELLAENDKASKDGKRLPLSVVQSLSFLIKAYLPKQKSSVPMHTVATRLRFQNRTGYSKSTEDFSLPLFENWLRSSLGENPFGVVACISSDSQLQWTMPTKGKSHTMKRSQVLCTSNITNAPYKTILFSQCSYQTIARQSSLLSRSYVKLHKCNNSQHYLLSPSRCVSIEKCQNSIFVLGPVSSCIRVIGCTNITVIAPCRLIIVGASKQVSAYVATPTRPILLAEHTSALRSDASSMVKLGPYHTYYGQLEQHLAEIGLVISPQSNRWNNPICLSHLMTSKGKTLNSETTPPKTSDANIEDLLFSICPPEDFVNFKIPFETINNDKCNDEFPLTTCIPWPLPKHYQDSVKQKELIITKYKSAVKDAKMTRSEKKRFQDFVESQFKEWLEKTGNKRQLDDLADLTKHYQQE